MTRRYSNRMKEMIKEMKNSFHLRVVHQRDFILFRSIDQIEFVVPTINKKNLSLFSYLTRLYQMPEVTVDQIIERFRFLNQ